MNRAGPIGYDARKPNLAIAANVLQVFVLFLEATMCMRCGLIN